MANEEMKYHGEKEQSDFTLVGTAHIYNFVNAYSEIPKVVIDNYSGEKPTVEITIDKVTITGADGDTGHLTVIEQS